MMFLPNWSTFLLDFMRFYEEAKKVKILVEK